jgi:hypothetical protein
MVSTSILLVAIKNAAVKLNRAYLKQSPDRRLQTDRLRISESRKPRGLNICEAFCRLFSVTRIYSVADQLPTGYYSSSIAPSVQGVISFPMLAWWTVATFPSPDKFHLLTGCFIFG